MKEILWATIIQGYRDHITNHNLRNKIAKQLQEEGIGSCRTCNPPKGSPPIAFLTFFSVASQNLLAQSYTSRTVVLFKQVLVALKEEKELTEGIIEIINELLTTLVYKYPSTLTERGAAIFIETLIQHINRFERAPTSGKLAKLISLYTIISKKDNLKEPIGTSKFIKASNWSTHQTPEPLKQLTVNQTPDNRTSLWNTFNIPETTSGINTIGLNEEENSWKSLDTGKLINPPGTPDTRTLITITPIRKIPQGISLEELLDQPLKNPSKGGSNLRFGPDRTDNQFNPITNYPPLLTFP